MTAFLNLDWLRAHAAPEALYDTLHRVDAMRPALAACWLTAPDGRLVCRWRTDDRASDDPPD
jgi:hypothetical protein